MEIQPASITQVRRARDGRRVWIDADVGNIAQNLKAISPKLSLQFNEKGEFFCVVEVVDGPDGLEERLVFTAQECDGRIVERARKICHPSYDLRAEMDRIDAEAEKRADDAFHEQAGEAGERAAHALRKDLEHKGKVFVKRAL